MLALHQLEGAHAEHIGVQRFAGIVDAGAGAAVDDGPDVDVVAQVGLEDQAEGLAVGVDRYRCRSPSRTPDLAGAPMQEQPEQSEVRPITTPSAYVSDGAQAAEHLFHIVCEDLFKIYKIADLEVVALRGLDIRVRRGELMGIVGSSGSGKSTLLNVLAGLDLPSAGAAWVNGRNLITMTEEDLVDYRRKEVGFVWQQTGRNLIPYLSAQQNVEIPLVLNGTPRRQAKRRAEELLTAVRLQDKLRSLPQALSGGEQQRISIAVALANGPGLLLADEPTGELDTHTSEEIFDLFSNLNKDLNKDLMAVTSAWLGLAKPGPGSSSHIRAARVYTANQKL